jgi:hypothetical protein
MMDFHTSIASYSHKNLSYYFKDYLITKLTLGQNLINVSDLPCKYTKKVGTHVKKVINPKVVEPIFVFK